MSLKSTRSLFRAVLCLAVAALTATALVACGDDEGAQELTFTLTTEGESSKISGPQSSDAGLTEITLENESDREGELQLIRIEGDHSPEEAIDALGGIIEGKPFPDWLFAAGGVAAIPAGSSATVTQVLEPGTYYAFDLEGEGPPAAKDVPTLDVTGEDANEELPEGDSVVTAIDYGFETEQLTAGKNEIVVDNVGDEPHHMIASPLIGDNTAEDVERFFKTEKGEPPLEEKGTQATAVLEGGEAQTVTVDLEPGRYVLYCFIADREGGPPHVFKGMVDEVEVE